MDIVNVEPTPPFVVTVTDPELTTVRLVTFNIETARSLVEVILREEYADLETIETDEGTSVQGDDDQIAMITIHYGVPLG